MLREPPMHRFMVDMRGPCQRHEDVYIEKENGHWLPARSKELTLGIRILTLDRRCNLLRTEGGRSYRNLKHSEPISPVQRSPGGYSTTGKF